METKKFKPLFDRIFFIICLVTLTLTVLSTVIPAIFYPRILFLMLPVDIFVLYFLISPLFGYVTLEETSLFIKYGLVLKKEIPYSKIRSAEKELKAYSESMMALKNAIEHVNIKYNTFDVTTVSVADNDGFIEELKRRISENKL